MIPEKRNEVIKHTAAVHISNTLSLIERKISNALLKHAYPTLNSKEEHEINISKLATTIGWEEGKGDKWIKDALTKLVDLKVTLNIIGKDNKNEWGITTLLSQARIRRGNCIYAYSPMLRELLYNPNIYARLNLDIQKRFRSKHALAVWEYLVEALCSAKANCLSGVIPIADLRTLLAVNTEFYDDFRQLNQKVLKPAFDEINKESDIDLQIDYERQQRKVVAINFQIKRKENYQHAFNFLNEQGAEEERYISKDELLLDKLVKEYKLSSVTAKRLVAMYPYEDIVMDLKVVDEALAAKKVKKIAALAKAAIEEHYGEHLQAEEKQNIENDADIDYINPFWSSVTSGLKSVVEEKTYKSWLSKISYKQRHENRLILVVPTRFIKQWVEDNYLDIIISTIQKVDSTIQFVDLEVIKLN